MQTETNPIVIVILKTVKCVHGPHLRICIKYFLFIQALKHKDKLGVESCKAVYQINYH